MAGRRAGRRAVVVVAAMEMVVTVVCRRQMAQGLKAAVWTMN